MNLRNRNGLCETAIEGDFWSIVHRSAVASSTGRYQWRVRCASAVNAWAARIRHMTSRFGHSPLLTLACLNLWLVVLVVHNNGRLDRPPSLEVWATGAVMSAIVSVFLLVLKAYTMDDDLGELAQIHLYAATRFVAHTREIPISDKRLEDRETFAWSRPLPKGIASRRICSSVYMGLPSTTHISYREAQRALQQAVDMTFSAEEIDILLRGELRKLGQARDSPPKM